MKELLTEDEKRAINMTGELWNLLCKVVGHQDTREADLNELVIHIHGIQRYVMAQAAVRAYPENFRGLGSVIGVGEDFDLRGLESLIPEPTEIPENHYQCAFCEGIYEKGWTDEEALAESRERFGDIPVEEQVSICVDCYQAVTKPEDWKRIYGPETSMPGV